MFHRTDFGGFLVCCYKAIQQLNGAEKNFVAISLMLNHKLTGLRRPFAISFDLFILLWRIFAIFTIFAKFAIFVKIANLRGDP